MLDVRPVEEFNEEHLQNAVNIPLSELEQELNLLPDNREVIAYCHGPHRVLAYEAVSKLREMGFNAFQYEAGVP